jgi:hypothetical protein
MTRGEIKRVFEAENILNTNLYRNGMCPSDFTAEEYLEDIYNIVNDKNYKNELIEENKGGMDDD